MEEPETTGGEQAGEQEAEQPDRYFDDAEKASEAGRKSGEERRRRKAEREAAEAAEIDPGPLEGEELIPDGLREMLHVYRRPARADVTGPQKKCRKWMDDDVKGFMAAKAKLEEAWILASGKRGGGVKEEADESEERCLGLLRELLEKRGWEK